MLQPLRSLSHDATRLLSWKFMKEEVKVSSLRPLQRVKYSRRFNRNESIAQTWVGIARSPSFTPIQTKNIHRITKQRSQSLIFKQIFGTTKLSTKTSCSCPHSHNWAGLIMSKHGWLASCHLNWYLQTSILTMLFLLINNTPFQVCMPLLVYNDSFFTRFFIRSMQFPFVWKGLSVRPEIASHSNGCWQRSPSGILILSFDIVNWYLLITLSPCTAADEDRYVKQNQNRSCNCVAYKYA